MSKKAIAFADRATAAVSVVMFALFLGLLWFVATPDDAESPRSGAPSLEVVSRTPGDEPREAEPLEETPLETGPSVLPLAAQYIEVVDSCGPYFDGACVNVRSGPGTSFPAVSQLRSGVVLKIAETIEADGRAWHRIAFDEWLRYPERVSGPWYVAADFVRPFSNAGPEDLAGASVAPSKRIVIDRSDQKLYAYDGEELFMEASISTGIELTPTPRGTFTIFRKTPTRYMQGPLPGISSKYYDLPGVPWNLYFTQQGAVIHGAYWHDQFGTPWSNGCVNLPTATAETLYHWADIGTTVVVRD